MLLPSLLKSGDQVYQKVINQLYQKMLLLNLLITFSEIYAPHIDKANSILSFRVDDENETTEEQQCNSRQ